MGDLSGKTAIITGAASGIGYAGVEVFMQAGATIVAGDLQDEKGKALETRFGSDRVRYVHCDVTKTDDLKTLFATAEDAFGGVDILWNNAGHGGTPTGVEELDEDGFDQTVALLLKSVFVGTKLAVYPTRITGGSFEQACRSSLERMGRDRLELVQAHWSAQRFQPWQEPALWDGLARCYEAGLAESVGTSNFGNKNTAGIFIAPLSPFNIRHPILLDMHKIMIC